MGPKSDPLQIANPIDEVWGRCLLASHMPTKGHSYVNAASILRSKRTTASSLLPLLMQSPYLGKSNRYTPFSQIGSRTGPGISLYVSSSCRYIRLWVGRRNDRKETSVDGPSGFVAYPSEERVNRRKDSLTCKPI